MSGLREAERALDPVGCVEGSSPICARECHRPSIRAARLRFRPCLWWRSLISKGRACVQQS
uniref:Uncharacterized protein n=1 Tax=Arundo donax TaxID=35708 RepID=A0A0A9CFG6_ARUDO